MKTTDVPLDKVEINSVKFHEALPPMLVDRLRAVKNVLGDADSTPWNDFLELFLYEREPQHEVAAWENIARAYSGALLALEEQMTAPTSQQDRRDLLTAAIAHSLGVRSGPDGQLVIPVVVEKPH